MALINSEPDHAEWVPAYQVDGSDSIPTSPLQSFLASWPAKLCLKCASMTSTMEGLGDMLSKEGYLHHRRRGLEESVAWGCELCVLIFSIASGNYGMEYRGNFTENTKGQAVQ